MNVPLLLNYSAGATRRHSSLALRLTTIPQLSIALPTVAMPTAAPLFKYSPICLSKWSMLASLSHVFPHRRLDLCRREYAGLQNRALLPCHQHFQEVWCLGADGRHCVHHCSCSPDVMCHCASWRDSEHGAASPTHFGADHITSFSVAADSFHWVALNRFCHLH